jgi:hypothetical protein
MVVPFVNADCTAALQLRANRDVAAIQLVGSEGAQNKPISPRFSQVVFVACCVPETAFHRPTGLSYQR